MDQDALLEKIVTEAQDAAFAGQVKKVMRLCREGLALDDGQPVLLWLLAALKERDGKTDEAITLLSLSLKRAPLRAETLVSLGELLAKKEEYEAAETILDQSHLHEWGAPDFLSLLGKVKEVLGKDEEALSCYRRFCAAMPASIEGLFHAGVIAARLRKPDEACLLLEKAHEGQKDNPYILSNLGIVYRRLGRLKEAVYAQEKALALKPDYPTAHWNLATALLADGQIMRGFAEYEWRFKRVRQEKRNFGLPLWDGDLSVKRLFIGGEQGAGDMIWAARYFSLLAEKGIEVVVELLPGLIPLFEQSNSIQSVIPYAPVPDRAAIAASGAEAALPAMSLARIFEAQNSPHPIHSFLPVDKRAAVRAEVRWRPAVGLVWAGNPDQEDDVYRSCPPEALLPLIKAFPEAAFYSLQMGPGRERTDFTLFDGRVHDLASCIHNYADTAALIDALDVLVTVDTSVAHIAGALSKKTLVLLGAHCDWRYLQGCDTTPWYPSFTLCRQTELGIWDQAVEQAVDALKKEL